MARLTLALLAVLATNVAAFAAMNTASQQRTPSELSAISRRESFARTAAVVGGVIGGISAASSPALAVVSEETPRVTTRMGGLLERYQDGPRGWSILAPSGWNKFEGEVGAYDVKWQDLVDPRENIKVSSSPVKSSTTSIDALGEVQEIGAKLAAKRDAKLIKAEERITDGILFYKFDFAINDGTHQLLQLCVNKGKVWSLDANTTEKRWAKREEMYDNVLGSFLPKLS
uniref:PsbP C-terminal domain-containing protein n=1 Tax=Helicotheca tamesis TaxID=374047 RepID=A0A7S2MZD3_9STRA|mmetsp:Transcript_6367/g.8602  ORF Transcript_6367/g.8602 Transcript_6367/m.8602 type:complete len:229 (+) Transcript_6367:155-841(+)|eukprot:CAMPEP_0185728862 /NCGR_PEP_ID=MMETSP1171-20130828/4266_1 /TAXON_ID=374046 /ORGANISM="Helicotheca tamensis, Strain CCMP826" /LENGTH=228 /DNA_ID=CAMNT_0028397611 /DNA_START=130 /DNA_END=816 /DNA_ORIENTATION=+